MIVQNAGGSRSRAARTRRKNVISARQKRVSFRGDLSLSHQYHMQQLYIEYIITEKPKCCLPQISQFTFYVTPASHDISFLRRGLQTRVELAELENGSSKSLSYGVLFSQTNVVAFHRRLRFTHRLPRFRVNVENMNAKMVFEPKFSTATLIFCKAQLYAVTVARITCLLLRSYNKTKRFNSSPAYSTTGSNDSVRLNAR